MLSRLRRLWLGLMYYLSWFWFGLGGLALNLICLPLLVLPNRERYGPAIRSATRRLFAWWLRWLHASRVIRIEWCGFENPLPSGVVYVANHPCLIDAPFLLAQLPDTVCIFKPSLLRNPLIGPAAILNGYVSAADQGVDLVRKAAARINAGQSLLVFPEGTRTNEDALINSFKPGFALIAARAACAVQLIRIRTSPHLVRRGRPWWQMPELPAWAEFTLDKQYPVDADTDLHGLVGLIEARYKEVLVEAVA